MGDVTGVRLGDCAVKKKNKKCLFCCVCCFVLSCENKAKLKKKIKKNKKSLQNFLNLDPGLVCEMV